MATLTTLVSFDESTNGGEPQGGLTMDATGDLYGTTSDGGSGLGGTVFELVDTGSGYTFQTLYSLSTALPAPYFPEGGVTFDSAGDLFLTAPQGGSGSLAFGAVLELTPSGSTYIPQTVVSFDFTNGATPDGPLYTDSSGNLFGTSESGPGGFGTVFELVKSGSGYTFQTTATFSGLNGETPVGGLVADASGDLFGVTKLGGTSNLGTVYELVKSGSSYTLQSLVSFTGASGIGAEPGPGNLLIDAQGNLYGETIFGGSSGQGTVYELVKSGSGYTLQTLYWFTGGADGGRPQGGLIMDANGDLFGEANIGGAGVITPTGTVFELIKSGSGYTLGVLATFSGASGSTTGSSPVGGLTVDANGNLFGETETGGQSGHGTVFEITGSGFVTPPLDDDSAEQAALQLTVNGGSTTPIGAAGVHDVAFTIGGLDPEDTGVVTFTDSASQTVTVDVTAGETTYNVDLSSLTDGSISASLQVATDAASNSFLPVAGNGVTVDSVAPGKPGAPADASVAGGWVNLVNDTVGQTISGTTEANASVSISDNGSLVTTVIANGSGHWSYNVGVLSDGAYSYTVTAADAAGNTSVSSDPLTFTVDTVAPGKPGAPTDASIVGGWVNLANDGSGQTIGGTAEANTSIAISNNGALVATVLTSGGGHWSYNVGALADGAYSYTVAATDAAGNTGVSSDGLIFTVDTMAPVAPTGLTDSAMVGGVVDQTGDTTGQTLTGNAEAGSFVAVYNNGSLLGTTMADQTTGAWSYGLGVLASGPQSLTARATDAAGNTGAASQPLAFTVDIAAPIPAVTDVVNSPLTHLTTISGTSEAGSTVTVFDGSKQIGGAVTNSQGVWSLTLNLSANTIHHFTENALDTAGDRGASAGTALYTNAANNKLVGGVGDDVLVGRPGDTLTGGGGQDHFVLNPNFGKETVTDFAPGTGDQLWFDHTVFGSFSSVLAHAKLSGGDTVIAFDGSDYVTLKGVPPSALGAHDFMFF